ncbi:MAG: hypothetical protein R3E48_09180 [Burkholderiaceae bacterium]
MSRIVSSLAAAWVLAANAPAAAGEVPVDITSCWGGNLRVLAPAKGQVFLTYDVTGLFRSNTPGGAFDATSFECVGSVEYLNGVPSEVGHCVSVDRDGDKTWGRSLRSKTEDNWVFIGGTGKYAGITGTLKRDRRVQGRPARAGTTQGCGRSSGTYRVP